MAEETLKASEFWNANYGSKLREWFENTWLEEKEVSIFVFILRMFFRDSGRFENLRRMLHTIAVIRS